MKGTRSARKRQQLEEQFFNLERKTAVPDELNEENVEEATLNYANNVAQSEKLVEKALIEKSVKCFSIDSKICQNISVGIAFLVRSPFCPLKHLI